MVGQKLLGTHDNQKAYERNGIHAILYSAFVVGLTQHAFLLLTPFLFLPRLLAFCRYMEIPLISRLYLTGAFLTTAACAVDLISPFALYFNWELVFSQGQVWRLITR